MEAGDARAGRSSSLNMRRRRGTSGPSLRTDDSAANSPLPDINSRGASVRAPEADREVVDAAASQVGTDTWKTWAGRKDGHDEFQFSDLFSGVSAHTRHAWRRRRGDERRPGKACPICAEDNPEPDAQGKRWLRPFCGCTVCSACVQGWNMALLEQHQGVVSSSLKITCPACSAPMRPADVKEALARCPKVAERYDQLSREEMLRAMPEWRNCPHCDGGGFTTGDCLAPLHTKVSLEARDIAMGYVWSGIIMHVVSLVAACVFNTLANSVLSLAFACFMLRWFAADAARLVAEKAQSPLSVGCPECSGNFLLAGYGEALAEADAGRAQAETTRWLNENTRPCPSCGAAIEKSGGCNSMKCSRCRLKFCWACMRPRASCGPYGCHNGAPYGNASSIDAPLAVEQVTRRTIFGIEDATEITIELSQFASNEWKWWLMSRGLIWVLSAFLRFQNLWVLTLLLTLLLVVLLVAVSLGFLVAFWNNDGLLIATWLLVARLFLEDIT